MNEREGVDVRGGVRVVRSGREGAGPPVLLLHGFTGGADAWGNDLLAALSRDRPVLAVDLPGHGGSEAPVDPEGYRIERVVDHLTGVLDRAGLPAADWVGYSMGARVALAGAVLRPGRVRRLVLEGGSPGLPTAEERARRRRDDEAIARRLEVEGIERFVDFWMERPIFASQRRLPAERLWAARRVRLGQRADALAAVLRGLGTGRQPPYWERLEEVASPVLLLTGGLDRKFGALAQAMAERLSDARSAVVPDAGHAVHLEAPDAWLREVLAFLDRPSGRAGSGSHPVAP